jgi:hypothetical protein
MRRLSVPPVLAFLFYTALTVALTWPLPLQPGSLVPSDLGDPLLNVYLLNWNASEWPLTERWWDLPQFYPARGVMAYSEHLLGLSLIATPVIAITGNPLLAHNIVFLLTWPLSGMAAYFLVYVITRRHDAALVSGLAFAFAPYRMSQLAHVQVLSAYWMPVALAALHLYIGQPRARWAALFAAAWLVQALACGYYLIYLSVLAGLWLLWFGPGRLRWGGLLRLAAAWGLAALLLTPVLYGYWKWQHAYGLRRGIDEIVSFSADAMSLFKAPENVRLWGWLKVVEHPEADLFPTVTLVALVFTGAALAWRAAGSGGRERLRARRTLTIMAAVFAAIAATPAIVGPWQIQLAGMKLLSVRSAQKPLSLAVLLLIMASALHPSVREAWRLRSPLAFYVMAAVVMWFLSLGPSPTFMDTPFLYSAPYGWLLLLPGIEGVRVPARFWMLALLCLAVAAGLAVRHIVHRWPGLRTALPVVACAGLLIEAWPRPLRTEVPPELRPSRTSVVTRLELPLSSHHDPLALYRAVGHGRPVFNGYSGYFAPQYYALQYLLSEHDPEVLTRLSAYGAMEVVVDHEVDSDRQWRTFVSRHPQASETYTSDTHTAYRIERGRRVVELPAVEGQRVRIVSASSGNNAHLVRAISDDDMRTRWHAGRAQKPGDRITVDLGEVREVNGAEMLIGGFDADFPRLLEIETSVDGQAWTGAWSGGTALMAFTAAVEDPLEMRLPFLFDPARPARFLRFTQTAMDPTYYWSISELRVMGK